MRESYLIISKTEKGREVLVRWLFPGSVTKLVETGKYLFVSSFPLSAVKINQ